MESSPPGKAHHAHEKPTPLDFEAKEKALDIMSKAL
jgi:hypothetical protein